MEPVEVLARWQVDGSVVPLQFVWHQQTYSVESTGRTWQDQAGFHILVMTAAVQTFELIFHPTQLKWSLVPISLSRQTT